MKKYTEKIHRKRLVKMLQKKEPCDCCPAQKYYRKGTSMTHWGTRPCKICMNFLTILNLGGCPCAALGKKNAIELTIAVLKKKGDL